MELARTRVKVSVPFTSVSTNSHPLASELEAKPQVKKTLFSKNTIEAF